ncbi:hypothetical protein SAMN04487764_1827 [Gillisia sp. Hel1_33_143]|nr:hypothetical protein SAMN04487764_1827 [Gillisia sp. Hel1_33_143]
MKKFYFAIALISTIILGIIFKEKFLTINLSDTYYVINYSSLAILVGIGIIILFGSHHFIKKSVKIMR